MRKMFLVFIVGLIVFCTIVVWVAVNADKLIDTYSNKVVDSLIAAKKVQGIAINRLAFNRVHLSSLNTITWQDVSADIILQAFNIEVISGRHVEIHADALTLNLESFIGPEFSISVAGLEAKVANQGSFEKKNMQQFDSLTGGKASIQFKLDLLNQKTVVSQLKELLGDFKGIIDSGRSKYPITLSAVSSFSIRGENVKSLLRVEREGSEYVIVLNKESMEIISWLFEEKLTNPEIELLSRNPFRAPKLLRIKNEAQDVSLKAHVLNEVVPEDAYRHILWSYLLTKQYGLEFAQQVTNAHEQGVTDNTEAEHQMDYTNNRIGRQYALKKIKKKDILGQLFQDQAVIRKAAFQ